MSTQQARAVIHQLAYMYSWASLVSINSSVPEVAMLSTNPPEPWGFVFSTVSPSAMAILLFRLVPAILELLQVAYVIWESLP